MRTKERNTGRLAAAGGLALALAAGCGVPGSAPPRSPAPRDVVSIGYGTQSREEITGSISSVSPEDFGRGGVLRVEDLLERVPGLEVRRLSRGDFTVRIRGVGTLLGNPEPLLVIDDMPVSAGSLGSTLVSIHPQDIVRIDVLKDLASAAVYGIRGANGVIIVTTKRGR